MSVLGELQRYLEGSIELLAPDTEKILIEDLVSARRSGDNELVASAEHILAALERHRDRGGPDASHRLSQETVESLDRLRDICGIILGR